MTEYFDVVKEPNGDQWLVVKDVIEDPQYLTRSFIRSTHFESRPMPPAEPHRAAPGKAEGQRQAFVKQKGFSVFSLCWQHPPMSPAITGTPSSLPPLGDTGFVRLLRCGDGSDGSEGFHRTNAEVALTITLTLAIGRSERFSSA
jgi:hypothetical protein